MDPARGQQAAPHHAVEVAADLGAARKLVKAPVRAVVVDVVVTERHRVDAGVGGGSTELDERAGVEPVPPGAGRSSTMITSTSGSSIRASTKAMATAPCR